MRPLSAVTRIFTVSTWEAASFAVFTEYPYSSGSILVAREAGACVHRRLWSTGGHENRPEKHKNGLLMTTVIPTASFDGFINFEQPASAETYAYAAVSPELSRAARYTTESSADNGRTGEAHKAGKVQFFKKINIH